MYGATSRGLGILDPATGERVAVVTGFGDETNVSADQVHQPWVERDRLIVLNEQGRVLALNHP